MHKLIQGDVLTTEPEGLVHAILCDPPYELGFMGKDWDRSGVAFHLETWRKLASHLHPGGFVMAFASARGWHRLACAMEDAGLVIHPSIFGWAYGQGFPKASRIDTQVDRLRGDNAKVWAGHRYGLQALKPALEPIIVAQKPYGTKAVDAITSTGAGALNIDGGRIESTDKAVFPVGVVSDTESVFGGGKGMYADRARPQDSHPSGRWPSNLILEHSPECKTECIPECPIRLLDEQSGERPGFNGFAKPYALRMKGYGISEVVGQIPVQPGAKDTGGASRFFYQVQTQLDQADPVCYQAKASRSEREAGVEGEPDGDRVKFWSGGRSLREGVWVELATPPTSRRNDHPTVKPLALARYLATLLLPPKEYAPRRLLVPFAGVGSEMIGALQAGWDEVVGIELEPDYVAMAELRIAHYQANPPKAKKSKTQKPKAQEPLPI